MGHRAPMMFKTPQNSTISCIQIFVAGGNISINQLDILSTTAITPSRKSCRHESVSGQRRRNTKLFDSAVFLPVCSFSCIHSITFDDQDLSYKGQDLDLPWHGDLLAKHRRP
jgi:hypothetical protein